MRCLIGRSIKGLKNTIADIDSSGQLHTLEMRDPIIRRLAIPLLVIPRRLPHIPIAVLIILRAARLLEPLMLVTRMVHDQIHEQLHAPIMTALDESLDVRDRAVFFGNAVVIGDVVAHVHLGRLVRRTEPDDVHADVLDVVQLGDDAGDVADAVIVGVFEGGGPDLVDGAFFPPGAVDLGAWFGHWEFDVGDRKCDSKDRMVVEGGMRGVVVVVVARISGGAADQLRRCTLRPVPPRSGRISGLHDLGSLSDTD